MSTAIVPDELLAQIGSVPDTYIHHDRVVEPRDHLLVPAGVLKWYNVFDAGNPVPTGLETSSRSWVEQFLQAEHVGLPYGLGMIVLHHSTEHDFLFIGTWQGHQEYWQRNFYRPVGADETWEAIAGGALTPTFCVWEMSPIWHERNAWVTYLKSDRTIDDRRRWLNDRLTAIM